MFALTMMAAAQAAVPMPTDFRGRWNCNLATRRSEPSKVTFWLYDERASTAGDDAAKIDSVRNAPLRSYQSRTAQGISITPQEFRSGSATVKIQHFKKVGWPGWLYVSVLADADADFGLPHETASGFCVAVMPMAPPRNSK